MIKQNKNKMNRKDITEAIDFESDEKNFKYPFKTMTKKYGKDYIDIIKALWESNGGGQSDEEFCKMNDLPSDFFYKNIKS